MAAPRSVDTAFARSCCARARHCEARSAEAIQQDFAVSRPLAALGLAGVLIALLAAGMACVGGGGGGGGGLPLPIAGGGGGVPPIAPTLQAPVPADSQVTLSWPSVSGATSYNLYYGTTAGVTTTTGTAHTGVTSPHTHTGLTNGTTHYFVLTAVNAAGESTISAEVSATPQAGGGSPPRWTVMVYGHGDHNLTPSLYVDMNEMEAVGSSNDFSIVVGADFNAAIAGGLNSQYGLQIEANPGMFRYLLQQDSDLNVLSTPPIMRLAEQNLDDPTNLTSFITWCVSQYPADRYGLVLWDHGGQWVGGFGGDQQDSVGSPAPLGSMNLPQIAQAIGSGLTQSSVAKLDFLGFDTCLNGSVEYIAEFAAVTDVYIACPEVDFGAGWDYIATLSYLKSYPSVGAAQFAAQEVADWQAHHFVSSSPDDSALGMHAAYDMTRELSLRNALDAFADALRGAMPTESILIAKLRRLSVEYGRDLSDLRMPRKYIDLGDFAAQVAAASANGTLAAAAQTLANEIASLVIAAAKGSALTRASGLNIYFPTNLNGNLWQEFTGAGGYRFTKLGYISRWDDFLYDYLANYWAADTQGPGVALTQGNTTNVTSSNPATATIGITGTDVWSLTATVYRETSLGSQVYLDFGEFHSVIAVYPQYQLTWKGNGLVLADGTNAAYMGGIFANFNSNFFYARALVTSTWGTSVDVLLVLDTNASTLVGALDADNPSLRGVDLNPGDQITPYLYKYDYNSSPPTVSMILTTSVPIIVPSVGISGLQVTSAPLPTGNYVIGFSVDDVWDNATNKFMSVTVP